MLSLDEAKQFMRIEHGEDDTFILSLINASKNYILNATDKDADVESELFILAQNFLILHWYENRNTVQPGTLNQVPFTLENLLYMIRATTEAAS